MPRRNRARGGRARDGRWGSPRKQPPSWDDERDYPQQTPQRSRPEHRRRPVDDEVMVIELRERAPVATVCGNCREYFPDEVGGRGTCEHPGSGFLNPWSDTPGCPFFAAR